MERPQRVTLNMLKILRLLLENPDVERYGLELGKAAGVAGNGLYPVLMRLENSGVLTSTWEDTATASEAGRPRRRLYRLTPDGVEYARDVLAEARQDLTPTQQRVPGWGRTAGLPTPGGAPA
jgi:PadR family transcriptional regulator, regulatory protein PadR